MGGLVSTVGRASWRVGLRVACLGLLFGPLTALLVHCMVTLRPARWCCG